MANIDEIIAGLVLCIEHPDLLDASLYDGILTGAMDYLIEIRKQRCEQNKPVENKDNVDHPSHYNTGSIEVIDIIEDADFGYGFNRGNAVKYILRAGRKSRETEIEDLKKALWYIQREIERISSKENT